jgi:hypothetical protein
LKSDVISCAFPLRVPAVDVFCDISTVYKVLLVHVHRSFALGARSRTFSVRRVEDEFNSSYSRDPFLLSLCRAKITQRTRLVCVRQWPDDLQGNANGTDGTDGTVASPNESAVPTPPLHHLLSSSSLFPFSNSRTLNFLDENRYICRPNQVINLRTYCVIVETIGSAQLVPTYCVMVETIGSIQLIPTYRVVIETIGSIRLIPAYCVVI